MKTTLPKTTLLFLPLLALFGIASFQFQTPIVQQGFASVTPTYDPLAEPLLPPNPTELELGRNLYWHWCMTCHGDQGQGLTDEFRGIWDPDHQNCWARGCHAGRKEDFGFPIPTVVPGLVNGNHLAQFNSLQELADFLKATHPPQSPGVLADEEYHAIALFVFTMNGRAPETEISMTAPISTSTIAPTTVPASTPTETLIPPAASTNGPYPTLNNMIAIAAILLVICLVALGRIRIQKRKALDGEID
jgi:hypothetical protein